MTRRASAWTVAVGCVLALGPAVASAQGAFSVGPVSAAPGTVARGALDVPAAGGDGGASIPVTVIHGATNAIVKAIGVGVSPYAIAWNPVQNRMYVVNSFHGTMTVIRDSMPPGVEEREASDVRNTASGATVVRGVLALRESPVAGHESQVDLLDISGRKVMSLLPGPNDVRHLAPGVYFLRRANGDGRVANSRVIVAR